MSYREVARERKQFLVTHLQISAIELYFIYFASSTDEDKVDNSRSRLLQRSDSMVSAQFISLTHVFSYATGCNHTLTPSDTPTKHSSSSFNKTISDRVMRRLPPYY